MLEQIERKLSQLDWDRQEFPYDDPAARQELSDRIAEAGKRLGMITYSDLVHNVEFRIPNVQGGAPYLIDVQDWSGLDRAIIGSFLGRISADSYKLGGFLATALVVNRAEFKPSEQFFHWMRALDVLPDESEDTVLAFWI